jgi:hypothetical protein
MSNELEVSEDFDPESRELCPDGACVGVIGSDGKCKVCGRASDGSATKPKAKSKSKSESKSEPEPKPEPEHVSAPEASSDSDPELATRELCPDGACIGVIGADGKCKVCGRALHS